MYNTLKGVNHMKKLYTVSLYFILIVGLFLTTINVSAATAEDNIEYTKTQYKDTLNVKSTPEIYFIKNDLSIINWNNPITTNDNSNFGLLAKFNLENIDEIIQQVADGEIQSMPSYISGFVKQFQRNAIISGSFNLTIDINPGLVKYFSVNDITLKEIKENPNRLLTNPIYEEIFEVLDVKEENNVIDILVTVKDNVTGAKLLDVKEKVKTLDLSIPNLFELNSILWSDVDEINKGEFQKLTKISADDTTFIVNIPKNLEFMAGWVGAKNPFVGIKLDMEPSFGSLNLGFVVVYDGNNNDFGQAPVDKKSPYNDNDYVTLLGKQNLERKGYRFLGWSFSPENKENKILSENDVFQISKNSILYAQWEPVKEGNVTANYVDEDGNVISDQVITNGNIGDPYSTEQKTIDGYTFKEVQGNPTGEYVEGIIEVTYIYTKDVDPVDPVNPVDPTDPVDPVDSVNPTSPETLPQTGVSDQIPLYGLLMLLSGSLLVLLNKKKQLNKK